MARIEMDSDSKVALFPVLETLQAHFGHSGCFQGVTSRRAARGSLIVDRMALLEVFFPKQFTVASALLFLCFLEKLILPGTNIISQGCRSYAGRLLFTKQKLHVKRASKRKQSGRFAFWKN